MEDFTFVPSENPGAHERHLIRRHQNPLFEERMTHVNSDSLMHAQKEDHELLQKFMLDFRDIITQATSLKPNEDSEIILEVKDKLDKLYAASVSVADDQSRVKESIKKLLGIIMKSVRAGAGDDAHAMQELEQEEMAREANMAFLESKLVADILDPDSPIEDKDLVPTLLSADKDDLALAVQLFDPDQLDYILIEGEKLLNKVESEGHDVSKAAESYVFIEGYKQFLTQQHTSSAN